MRQIQKIATPGSIAAGQTSTFNLPLGPTYHRIYIELTAATTGNTPVPVAAADWGTFIDDIRLIVNGDTRIEWNAVDLVAFNTYNGQTPEPGVLPIFLSLPWMRTTIGEDSTAYGTASGMASFTLELDMKTGIDIGVLEARAVVDEPQAWGAHLRVQRFNKQFGLQGDVEVSDLPLGPYNMLGMHISSDAVDKVELLANNVKIFDTTKRLRDTHQGIIGKVPQTGYTHIELLGENRNSEALPMLMNDFRLTMGLTSDNVQMRLAAVSVQGVQ